MHAHTCRHQRRAAGTHPHTAMSAPRPTSRQAAAAAPAASHLGHSFAAIRVTPGPAQIQRYAAPDWDWMRKTGADAASATLRHVEAVPGIGNMASGFSAISGLGMAAGNYLTGDEAGARNRLLGAENDAINAIPIFGNYRAQQQARHDMDTLRGDLAGADPATNQSSTRQWADGGADRFHSAVGDVWDSLF